MFEEGRLLVFRPGDAITLRARGNARIMLLGGEPMDGPRHVWWNFVSSSKDRIEAAKDERYPAKIVLVISNEPAAAVTPIAQDRCASAMLRPITP